MSLEYQRLPLAYSTPEDAFRRIGNAVNWLLNTLSLGADTGVVTYGADITDDAGDGTPHGDLNATDFTGHAYAEGDSLRILTNAVVTFGHKSVAYIWMGPSDVLVGGTQSGKYTAVARDLVPIGTADHSLLLNRNLADQHPQSAVTSLVTDQQTQDNRLATLELHPPRGDNPHQVTHDQLVGQSPEPDPHPQYGKRHVGLLLGGDVSNFTLNSTDSKLVNYTLSGEWNWPDDLDIDPVAGEITIPESGVYQVVVNVLGVQGNDTKEEWIELKINIAGGPDPGRFTSAFLDVTTDKTSVRQLLTVYTRPAYEGEVYSVWMWASAGLGTFNVEACTFEMVKIADAGEVA